MKLGLWTGFFLNEEKPLSLQALLSDVSRLKAAGFHCGELDERNAFHLFVDCSEHEAINNAKEVAKLCFFTQVHLPKPMENNAEQIICEKRMIMGCDILNVRKAVTHPFITYLDEEEPVIRNLEYLNRIVKSAAEADIKIGLENQIYPVSILKYLQQIPSLGVTLDFAHGIASGEKIPEMVRLFGRRLYCLHVSDSDGRKEDYHIMPGAGILNWNETILALKEVRFEGDFHLEIVHERSKNPVENNNSAKAANMIVSAILEATTT